MYLGVPKSMVVRLGWTALSYGAVQFLRLINNVVLARLLAPQIFGLMAIVNAIRTGVELLTDVGISQNIISNERGEDPAFYNTAWTLQVFRGLSLAVACFLLAQPIALFFGQPELTPVLRVAALFFVFNGFDSTARGLLGKRLEVARYSRFEVYVTICAVAAQVAIAFITRSVWALVLGSVVTGAVSLVASFMFIPGLRHRFMIDRESAAQLLRFGKWVFLSSVVYFLAMNFDRLYFAKQITMSQLGIYGIARALADMVTVFVARASTSVLYPTVAAAGLAPADLRQRLLRGRRTLLTMAAVGMGAFFGLSETIVSVLYDPRYAFAGQILPILCIGVWFGILTSTNDSILMGLARPAYPALSNSAKFITYLVGVPLAFHFYGFIAAIAVISAGELVKYVALWALSHKEHLRFGRDDLVLTILFAVTGALVWEAVRRLGLGTGAGNWHAFLRSQL
jgi:O-antigen/teichoic acid export membrane protein